MYSNQFPIAPLPTTGTLWLGNKIVASGLPFNQLQILKQSFQVRGYKDLRISY